MRWRLDRRGQRVINAARLCFGHPGTLAKAGGVGGGAGGEDDKQASCQVDGDRSAVEKRSLEMAKEVCK